MCLWPEGLCSLGRPDIDKGLRSSPASKIQEASRDAYLTIDICKPGDPEVPGSSVPHEDARGSETMPSAMPFMKVGAHPTLTTPAMLNEIVNDWHCLSSMPKTTKNF